MDWKGYLRIWLRHSQDAILQSFQSNSAEVPLGEPEIQQNYLVAGMSTAVVIALG
jgi:hypothetical protein